MDLKTVLLDNNKYHEYLNGQEVECPASKINTRNIQPGDHIMVYKDSLGVKTGVGVPTREKQSDYIGVEGTVTQVNKLAREEGDNTILQSLVIKML